MVKLGVNIDHVATLRQARREKDPDPIPAAQICESAGANSIVAHLREDRRHIQDADIYRLKRSLKIRFNLEMSIDPQIINIALKLRPNQATLVPERRQEITTEGGLDVVKHISKVSKAVHSLQKNGITASLFVAPSKPQIYFAYQSGARMIELHTGQYALAKSSAVVSRELQKIKDCTALAQKLGMTVNAGHGLNYMNVKPIASIPGMEELNIGHSIISYAVFVGLETAVKKMLTLIR